MADRDEVRRELEELAEEAKQFTTADLRNGTWFSWLLRHALATYAEQVDAAWFERKYPGLNRDAIVDRRIHLAQQYAAIAGGLSASATRPPSSRPSARWAAPPPSPSRPPACRSRPTSSS